MASGFRLLNYENIVSTPVLWPGTVLLVAEWGLEMHAGTQSKRVRV